MVSAAQLVVEALHTLVDGIWPIPRPLQKRLFLALKSSPCSRAVTLRHHMALVGYHDLDRFFAQTATPAFMMALFDDLVATGAFTRHEGSALQDAVLSGVRADGTWLSYNDHTERTAHG